MTAIVIVIVNFLVAGALCVSIVRFWRESRLGAESVRRLAALSSALTLAIVVIIYSGEFRHQTLLALGELGASKGLHEAAVDVLTRFDNICTDVANAINNVLGAEPVGFRPFPPIWPAVILGLGYLIRFVIYRFHTRKRNTEAALSGAVYWSHITTYVMVLAFLIVISGADPSVLVPVSLIALGAIIVSVKLLIEDFGKVLGAVAKTLWTEVSRAAGWIAYIATEVAGFVREALTYASKAYLQHIRKPLERAIEAVDNRNDKTRTDIERRLARQNTRHEKRFGESPVSDDELPKT
ncbi:MAG TPA: hypothetical protein VIH47_06420 [Solirubrobacterales bacterium]